MAEDVLHLLPELGECNGLQQRLFRCQRPEQRGKILVHHVLTGGEQGLEILGAFVLEENQRVGQSQIFLVKQAAEYL